MRVCQEAGRQAGIAWMRMWGETCLSSVAVPSPVNHLGKCVWDLHGPGDGDDIHSDNMEKLTLTLCPVPDSVLKTSKRIFEPTAILQHRGN